MMAAGEPHIPVLLDEVVAAIGAKPGDVVIDGTFGAGGYTRAVLAGGPEHVLGIDRDPVALAIGNDLAAIEPRFAIRAGTFSDLDAIARDAGHETVDAVVIDIGVSSMQIDEAERGFSFMQDGPLDMRMSQAGKSAADYVNAMDEAPLADAIYRYGEERRSRRIARAIVQARAEAPITRTGQLAHIVAKAAGPSKPGHHPATRTFQALRILVNDELGELAGALQASERILAPGGRLVVVTFHSLEDRMVKDFLTARTGRTASGSRHMPLSAPSEAPTFRQSQRKAETASAAEIARNPRARSAKLRVAERTDAPVSAAFSHVA